MVEMMDPPRQYNILVLSSSRSDHNESVEQSLQSWIRTRPEPLDPLSGGEMLKSEFRVLNSSHGPKAYEAMWDLLTQGIQTPLIISIMPEDGAWDLMTSCDRFWQAVPEVQVVVCGSLEMIQDAERLRNELSPLMRQRAARNLIFQEISHISCEACFGSVLSNAFDKWYIAYTLRNHFSHVGNLLNTRVQELKLIQEELQEHRITLKRLQEGIIAPACETLEQISQFWETVSSHLQMENRHRGQELLTQLSASLQTASASLQFLITQEENDEDLSELLDCSGDLLDAE